MATTDLLSRVTDILCCKPSELAFYPVPKLMIRRVGDHEAYSALRASELGDGTLELREVQAPSKLLPQSSRRANALVGRRMRPGAKLWPMAASRRMLYVHLCLSSI